MVIWDTLLTVGPSSDHLASGLVGFDTTVHGNEFVVAEKVGDVTAKLSELGVMEGTRGQGDLACLLHESLQNLWVHVSLVAGTEASETVHKLAVLTVPNIHTITTLERNGGGSIVTTHCGIVELLEVLVVFGASEGSLDNRLNSIPMHII